MSGPCGCVHCKPVGQAAVVEGPVVHAPVELPTEPRLFRVHSRHWPPQDCTLHPDGRMTMQAHGQTLVSMLSFDDMRETSWREARIEWDPPPLPESGPEPEPIPAAVQDAIPLSAA
jgi:hypothetical protein